MSAEQPHRKRILVVDDDPANAESLALLLQVQGYAVTTAGSGQEALNRLRADPLPDLILLDLMMRGMSGWEFRERQRQDARLAAVPVVIISAVGEVAQRQDLLGDVGYLQKPVDVDKLNGAIRRFTAPKKPSVLVVDDEAGVRTLLGVVLRHHGHAVAEAAGGRRQGGGGTVSPAACGDRRGAARRANATVDGPATLAALKEINPDVRCCFMSGNTGRYSAEDLRAAGGACVLPKPFVSLSLLAQKLWDVATR